MLPSFLFFLVPTIIFYNIVRSSESGYGLDNASGKYIILTYGWVLFLFGPALEFIAIVFADPEDPGSYYRIIDIRILKFVVLILGGIVAGYWMNTRKICSKGSAIWFSFIPITLDIACFVAIKIALGYIYALSQ